MLSMLSRHSDKEKGHFIGNNVNDKTTTVISYQYKEPCDHAYSNGKNRVGVHLSVKTLITIITISFMPHVTNGIHVWIKLTNPQQGQEVYKGQRSFHIIFEISSPDVEKCGQFSLKNCK